MTAAVRRRHSDQTWEQDFQSTPSRALPNQALDGFLHAMTPGNAFGDDSSILPSEHVRVVFQNVDGLSASPTHETQQLLDEWLQREKVGIVLLSETKLYWPALPKGRQWRDRMRSAFPSGSMAEAAFNLHQDRSSTTGSVQYGGCAAAVLGRVAHANPSSGQDPFGLGRWSWIRIRGRMINRTEDEDFELEERGEEGEAPASHDVVVVSAYRPCRGDGRGVDTVSFQHRDFFLTEGRETAPREAFMEDLEAAIDLWTSWGCEIILGVDANENLSLQHETSFRARMSDRGLTESILTRHRGHPPATQKDNKVDPHPIDGIFTSAGISVSAAGYYAFDADVLSDHRALWLDFDLTAALGGVKPTCRPVRRLALRNRKVRRRYVKLAEEGYLQYDIPGRLAKWNKGLSDAGGVLSPSMETKFNQIQSHILIARRKAERHCRKVYRGGKDWSPMGQSIRDRRLLWKLLLQGHSGRATSSRKVRRLLSKTQLPDAWRLSIPELQLKLAEENKKLKDASAHQMACWRAQFLDQKKRDVGSDFQRSKSRYNRERHANLHLMKQKEEARRRRKARGKGFSGGLKVIQVDHIQPDGTVNDITVSHRPGVEAGCMAENAARYDQTRFPHPTPPMKAPLYQDFTMAMAEDHMQELLHGSYEISPSLAPPTRSFLEHCRIPDGLEPMSLKVSTEDHIRFWQRMPEKKGSEPHGLHNGHFKAATFSALLSLCDAVSRDIPLQTGMAPEHWRHLMNFAIEKKAGDFRVKAMRTIQLMVAESQANNKFCGRAAMQYAERKGLIPDGQFGSRKKHQAIDLALSKVLVWDLLAMRRLSAGWILNDAKSCFDRVVHWVAQVALQRFGLPYNAVKSMFLTLQTATHRVRTGFGDSTTSFSPPTVVPFQGCGQGNGAGPPIWVAISSILIAMMASAGFGFTALSALSSELLSAICFCFVDDSDVVEASPSVQVTGESLPPRMQEAMDLWSGGVKATGGAIRPDKSFWWLIDFQWHRSGKWCFKRIEDVAEDFELKVVDPEGRQVVLSRLQPDECERTLGVQMSPQFNPTAQKAVLLSAAKSWAKQVASGSLLPYDVIPLLKTTILKTLGYPMALTHLSTEEWTAILAPVLWVCLPKARVCRTFPREAVYGPLKYQGLGIPHPAGLQLTSQLEMLLRHPVNRTKTASFLDACFQSHLLETGTDYSLFQQVYENTAILTTDSWQKRVWKSMEQHDVHVEFISPQLPLHRAKDSLLMSVFIDAEVDQVDLMWLNWCRMYLEIVTVSDLVSADGSTIQLAPWLGRRFKHKRDLIQWPRSERPGEKHWKLWRETLTQTLLQDTSGSRRLRSSLGDWSDDFSLWDWLFSPSTSQLFHRHGHVWIRFDSLPPSRTCQHSFVLPCVPSFRVHPLPPDVGRATVDYLESSLQHSDRPVLFLSGVGTSDDPLPDPSGLVQARWRSLGSQISGTLGWVPEELVVEGDERLLVEALQLGVLRVVSDGSFKDEVGTAAAQILTTDGTAVIRVRCRCPGLPQNQSPYRSELIGILAGVMVVSWLRDTFPAGFLSSFCPIVTVACDGESALNNAFGCETLRPKQRQFDLISAIRSLAQSTKVEWRKHHVMGHQDDHGPLSNLDWWELRNVECDSAAKAFLRRLFAAQRLLPAPNLRFFSEPTSLFISGVKQSFLDSDAIMELITLPPLLAYWSRRDRLQQSAIEQIDWKVTRAMMTGLSSGRQRWITKHCVGMCGVGKFRERWGLDARNECPRCGEPEDVLHIPRCRHPSAHEAWSDRVLHLQSWLIAEQTAPDIATVILQFVETIRGPLSVAHVGANIRTSRRSSFIRAIDSQRVIGNQCFLEGLLSTHWAPLQQAHFSSIQSLRTGSRWAANLAAQLVELGFHMWQHRNLAQHSDDNVQHRFRHRNVNSAIREQFSMGCIDLSPAVSRMLNKPLREVLQLGLAPRERWLTVIRRERTIGRRSVIQQRALLHNFTHQVLPPARPTPHRRTYTPAPNQVFIYHQLQLPPAAPTARPAPPPRTLTRIPTKVVCYHQSTLPFSTIRPSD